MTTRDLIKKRLSEHTKNGYFVCSQSLLGVGAVANTIDLSDKTGLIELPVSDSSNPATIVGMSLAGRKPVYIIRFAGFGWLNFWSILNYSAKSKELWDISCPLFVRCISSEGSIGPVASNMNHSIAMHMPGVKVFAPLTASEWDKCWQTFLTSDGPIICSEYRKSYDIEGEIESAFQAYKPQVNIFAIGGARFEAEKAKIELHKQGIFANVVHIWELKPLYIPMSRTAPVNVVVDSDYTICGAVEHIAYELNTNYGIQPVNAKVLGLKDKSAGFAPHCDNITPSSYEIVEFIKKIL